jgi:glycosyltransferase involved in cell wall biosynthesis
MYEVFPLVVLEAFARQVPVVAHDRGALREMIEQSGGGLLYRTEDELLAALTRLAHSAELRSELGANGYRTVNTQWSKDAHLKKYFGLLRETALRKFGVVPWEAGEANRPPQVARG